MNYTKENIDPAVLLTDNTVEMSRTKNKKIFRDESLRVV